MEVRLGLFNHCHGVDWEIRPVPSKPPLVQNTLNLERRQAASARAVQAHGHRTTTGVEGNFDQSNEFLKTARQCTHMRNPDPVDGVR